MHDRPAQRRHVDDRPRRGGVTTGTAGGELSGRHTQRHQPRARCDAREAVVAGLAGDQARNGGAAAVTVREPVGRFDEVAAPNAAVSDGEVQVKLDKLLARTGLATSVTDGLRKVKQNAVKVDGELKTEIVTAVKLGTEFTLRAGKKMVKVSVSL